MIAIVVVSTGIVIVVVVVVVVVAVVSLASCDPVLSAHESRYSMGILCTNNFGLPVFF